MKLALRSAILALLALPALAQRVGTGTIRGSASRGVAEIQVRVTGTVERAGAPAANVSVTTRGAATQTDANGAFTLTQVAPLGGELFVTAAVRILGENWYASASFPVRSRIRADTLTLEPRSVSIPFAPLCAPGGQVWSDLDGDTDLDFVARSSGASRSSATPAMDSRRSSNRRGSTPWTCASWTSTSTGTRISWCSSP